MPPVPRTWGPVSNHPCNFRDGPPQLSIYTTPMPHRRHSAFARVTALAELRPVHEAFRWLHLNDQYLLRLQADLVAIPAPPFGEAARTLWAADQFPRIGLTDVTTDAIGNVYGTLHGSRPLTADGPVILISAHLDTVFPIETPLNPVLTHDRLECPGACDNAAGVIGLIALACALRHAGVQLPATLIFVANIGEEGEGDLRGVRFLYAHAPWASRVITHIVLDGAGDETVVSQALGSKRFQVTISGPGGHSFTDAGTPHPLAALAAALTVLDQFPLPDDPRTTRNIGTISGGTSVNSIPESATAAIDFRSTDVRELVRLEVALHRAVEDAVHAANARAGNGPGPGKGRLTSRIEVIGNRPAAELPAHSTMLETLRAVDRHLGLRTDLRLGSTDANIPLSLGIQAASFGAGGDGGGAHTQAEWYSAVNRELGLRRILLLTLAMAESAAGSIPQNPDA